MNGRQEKDAIIESRTLKTLEDYPVIIDYYYSMVNDTASAKESYCHYVRDYFLYLKEMGFDINSFSAFSNITIGDINRYMASDNMRYFIKNGVKTEKSGAIRRVRFFAIKKFFNYLENYGYINANPCAKIEAPKDTKQRTVVYMTEEDLDNTRFEIRNNISDRQDSELMATRNLLIFNIGVRTGLRKSAIAAINVEDIDLNEGKITVTEKGNITRDVWIGKDTIALIREWLEIRAKILGHDTETCHALFISNRKKRISNQAIYIIITEATKKLGKHISPHKMRSTCAVMVYQKTGGNIYASGETLGHKSIQTTKKYVTVLQEEKISIANMLDSL